VNFCAFPQLRNLRNKYIAVATHKACASLGHPGGNAVLANDLLQLAILFLELMQALHLRRHQTAVLLTPIVVRGLAHPSLATDLTDCCTFLPLP